MNTYLDSSENSSNAETLTTIIKFIETERLRNKDKTFVKIILGDSEMEVMYGMTTSFLPQSRMNIPPPPQANLASVDNPKINVVEVPNIPEFQGPQPAPQN
jgi:hypothetical protein